ncbi:HTH domain-containing protein [Halomarina halobia]|uniref:HTH domain-containing protein n=1 Tax=Halomarina halobia TaxID=3033386 RepID=A0ABD6A724_9EURY|nr:HTH domain-containing protein [Halomarina sp. PSR21]
MTVESDPPRVELRVRECTPVGVHDRQEAVYEQLEQLREAGAIADVTVEVWGKQVRVGATTDPAAADAAVRAARSTYEEFEVWAERTGHRLEPAFSTHTLGSLVTDEQVEVVRFPTMCLAVYDADDLLTVVPCSTDEGVRTVGDYLATLRSGEWTPAAVEARR